MANGGNSAGFPLLPCASMGEGGQSIMRQDVFRLGGNIMLRLKSLIAFIAFDFVKSHRDQWPGEGSFLKLFIWSKEPSSARWAPSRPLRTGKGESDQGPVQLQSPPLFSLGLIPQ